MIGEYENDAQKTHRDMSWKYICPSRKEREVKKEKHRKMTTPTTTTTMKWNDGFRMNVEWKSFAHKKHVEEKNDCQRQNKFVRLAHLEIGNGQSLSTRHCFKIHFYGKFQHANVWNMIDDEFQDWLRSVMKWIYTFGKWPVLGRIWVIYYRMWTVCECLCMRWGQMIS